MQDTGLARRWRQRIISSWVFLLFLKFFRVLHTVFNTLPPEDVAYDVISGVSAGSINAGGFSMFEKGAEKEAIDWMVGLWSDITQSDVFVVEPHNHFIFEELPRRTGALVLRKTFHL